MLRGSWVPPKLLKAHKSVDEDAIQTIYFLMRHMGWGYRETMDVPIPAAIEILKLAERELKEQKKAWSKR